MGKRGGGHIAAAGQDGSWRINRLGPDGVEKHAHLPHPGGIAARVERVGRDHGVVLAVAVVHAHAILALHHLVVVDGLREGDAVEVGNVKLLDLARFHVQQRRARVLLCRCRHCGRKQQGRDR